jgi:serine/threonine-protein kinase
VIARQPTEVMPPPEPEGSSKRIWLGVLIGILIVAILAGAGYLLAQSLGNKDAATKPMPDVKGQPYDTASATLHNDYGLSVIKQTQPSSKTLGTVLDQSVAPNDPVASGDSVTLTVAAPQPLIVVPSLRCFTLDQAQGALPNGLSLGGKATAATPDTSCQPGTIIDQTPAAGDQVKKGTLVSVTLNPSTPTTVTLADYTCVNFSKAKAQLKQLGLVVAFQGTTTPLAQCPNPNFVALQDPAAGTVVPVGSTVNLYTGSEQSPTPTGSASP